MSVSAARTAGGIAAEVRQGKQVAQTAADTGVAHFLYSSVGGADRNSAVPHFESKWQIEQYMQDLELPATVLRPVFFMENLLGYGGPQPAGNALLLRQALRPDTALQMIAVDDIGAFAALAFADPDEYRGTQLELAGDELTGPQMAELFGELTGMPTRYEQQPLEEVRAFSDDMAAMYEFFDNGGYQADIAHLRTLHPRLRSLRTWIAETGWTRPGTQPAAQATA